MILWLNPSSGISGDMLLGALIDLGAPVDAIEDAIRSSGISGWSIAPRRVQKNGIGATYAGVTTDDTASERTASELIDMAARVAPAPVARLAVRALREIARVEAGIHDADPGHVHLHEIGGVDTIVDVVGVAAALHALSIDRVYSGSVALGGGTVVSAHGTLPSPAPAALGLLEGARVHWIDVDSETTTPTGAALLRAFGTRYEPLDGFVIRKVGHGAGTKDFAHRPNVLQACLGEAAQTVATDGRMRDMTVLETNVDDVTGELLADLISGAMSRGAADAWIVQTIGKKGRPAAVVHVLTKTDNASALTTFLHEETGSLGVRWTPVLRHELDRWSGEVQIEGVPIGVKYSTVGQKPERDDVVRAAREIGRPVRLVAAEAAALAAAHRGDRPRPAHGGDDPAPPVPSFGLWTLDDDPGRDPAHPGARHDHHH
jgi:uncharacterized protein (TIGR00299 family) protein